MLNRCSAFGVSPNPIARRGKKSHYKALKSHYDADNLNMMNTMMPTKRMMVLMSGVMLVFVDLGKCSAKSSAVEEGDIII